MMQCVPTASQRRQNIFDNDGNAVTIGVDAVAQIEARVSGYTIQEKRIKHQPILFGKARIKIIESLP